MIKKAPKVLIYHTTLSNNATKDDLDVLDEARFVSGVLSNIGYDIEQRPFNYKIKKEVSEIKPSFIFNLVEAIDGKDSLAYLASENFERLGIPYTGCTKRTFLDTKDKVDVKRQLRKQDILTPYWLTLRDFQRLDLPKKKFLIKSRINHASKNLEATLLENKEDIKDALRFKGDDFFAEEYIDGREFNVSIVGPLGEGQVLPPAEMLFTNWPKDKLKIVDYVAKWDENSHESKNTVRNFSFPESDRVLIENLKIISKRCWDIFDLRGYARVDFRVDENNKLYVLEINANPCISPDSGFIAATKEAGISKEQVIKNIIKDSCGEKFVL